MKHWFLFKIMAFLILSASIAHSKERVAESFKFAEQQSPVMLGEIDGARAKSNNPKLLLPRTLAKTGNLSIVNISD